MPEKPAESAVCAAVAAVFVAVLRACCWRPRAWPPFFAAARRFAGVAEPDDRLLAVERCEVELLRVEEPLEAEPLRFRVAPELPLEGERPPVERERVPEPEPPLEREPLPELALRAPELPEPPPLREPPDPDPPDFEPREPPPDERPPEPPDELEEPPRPLRDPLLLSAMSSASSVAFCK